MYLALSEKAMVRYRVGGIDWNLSAYIAPGTLTSEILSKAQPNFENFSVTHIEIEQRPLICFCLLIQMQSTEQGLAFYNQVAVFAPGIQCTSAGKPCVCLYALLESRLLFTRAKEFCTLLITYFNAYLKTYLRPTYPVVFSEKRIVMEIPFSYFLVVFSCHDR